MNKQNHEIRVKLSNHEKEKIVRKARGLGLTASAFLRLLGLSAKTPLELP